MNSYCKIAHWMRKEHHYQQEEESRAVIPSLSALISGAKQCQGEADALCPGHWKNKPSWEPQTSLYIQKHLTLPPAVLHGLWRPGCSWTHVFGVGSSSISFSAGNKGLGSVLLWELCRGDVGQGTHQGGWDNSHQWPGELSSVFKAAFPAKWNDFMERLSLEPIFYLSSKLGRSHRLTVTVSPSSRASLCPTHMGWGAAGRIPLCPPFPSFRARH